MLFFTTTPRFFTLLLGLLFVDGTVDRRGCQNVPIHVDVNIQPPNDTEPVLCTIDQELTLRFHIQKVVDSRIYDYFFYWDSIHALFRGVYVGAACLETIVPQTSDRRLMPFGGFNYDFGVHCTFCNGDDRDIAPPGVVTSEPSVSPAPSVSFAPSPVPSSTPMPSNSFAFSLSEEVARISTATLERQLTRKLTQKVNKNRESCFRGSNSIVTVSVELEDFLVASRCTLTP